MRNKRLLTQQMQKIHLVFYSLLTRSNNSSTEESAQFSFWFNLIKRIFMFLKEKNKDSEDYWSFFTSVFMEVAQNFDFEL